MNKCQKNKLIISVIYIMHKFQLTAPTTNVDFSTSQHVHIHEKINGEME